MPLNEFSGFRRSIVAACACAIGLPGLAAASTSAVTGDAKAGRALFEHTAQASGVAGLPSCTDCHGSVESRRIAISGNAYGPLSAEMAMAHFAQAVSQRAEMQPFQALSSMQAHDLAAYLADTPTLEPRRLDFTPDATDTPQSLPIELHHAQATNATLEITGLRLSGTDAADFRIDADACSSQTLRAGDSCRVTLSFRSHDTAGKSATIELVMQPSDERAGIARKAALGGVVQVVAPPASAPTGTPPGTPASAPNSGTNSAGADEGGGSFDGAGLLGLLIATSACVTASQRRAGNRRRRSWRRR